MHLKIILLVLYFLVIVLLGILARSRFKQTPGEYFLAGRSFGAVVLIGTMVATNFSAFTVFGTSGAGYRDGLSFFPIMGFGTGFMALSFWIIGRKVWKIGKEHNLITPSELVHKLYNSRILSVLFAVILIIFTIPYLAIQPMAGGAVLGKVFGIKPYYGAIIITLVMVSYVLRGGMRADAWVDIFQGVVMFLFLVVTFICVANYHGGFSSAFSKILQNNPDLLSRPGGTEKYTYGIWFSYMALWFLCDPMFPQLFQRFYAAKSEKPIAWMMLLYPLICTVVFILPVAIGIMGQLSFPGLDAKESDNVISMLALEAGGDLLGTIILTAGLAALMSTMDSQLLALSAIFTRDILPSFTGGKEYSPVVGKVFVAILAVCGLAIAINPPSTIQEIATWAFTGFAVLFPTVLFGLYLKKPSAWAGIVSLIVGEVLVVFYALKMLPSFGFLPVIPIVAIAVLVYLAIQVGFKSVNMVRIHPRNWWYAAGFAGIFILAMDFWSWGKTGVLVLGLPSWGWYFVALSGLQMILVYYWVKPFLMREKESD
jgi:SSS family solute:Na+ symporter